MDKNQIVLGWGWMAPRNRPKRLEKKLRRRGYMRVIGKRPPPVSWAVEHEPYKSVCFCYAMFGQSCHVCDPNGTMYSPIRPELAIRIIGC